MNKSWIALLLALAGCASAPPASGPLYSAAAPPRPAPDKALVIIYRSDSFEGAGAIARIYADGQNIGPVSALGYIHADASPGRHTFTGAMPNCDVVPLMLDVAAGRIYYLRYRFDYHVAGNNACELASVDPETAATELSTLHDQGAGNVIL